MLAKSDIPFSRDDANRFLPWMIALMCAITALMLSVGLTLGQWVRVQAAGYSDTVSVQIPYMGERTAQAAAQVSAQLQKLPGVKTVTPLTTAQVGKLVEPWLGTADLDNLPLPAVIDVTFIPTASGKPASIDTEGLKRVFDTIAPGITIDTREVWVAKFAKLSDAVQAGVFSLAVFIVAALAGMMVFTARAAMKLHAGTVQLMHAIGADDRYIARQFQQNAMLLSLRGALPGTAAAGAVYALLGLYTNRLDAPLMPSFGLSGTHIAMLIALPLLAALIGVVSVRLATMAQLRLLP